MKFIYETNVAILRFFILCFLFTTIVVSFLIYKKEHPRIMCQELIDYISERSLLYETDHNKKAETLQSLINEGYISESQKYCPNGGRLLVFDGEVIFINLSD